MATKPTGTSDYTDPPGMPEDERMTDAELRTIREWLGVTGDWLAGHLQVNPRTVRDWEQGRRPVPDRIRIAIEELEAVTGHAVGEAVTQLGDVPDPVAVVYRDDEEYHAAHPEMSAWPASWHRRVVARAALEVPALAIEYSKD